MLGNRNIIGFIPSLDKAKARSFYEDVVGLKYKEEDAFAIVMDANGIDIRIVYVGEFTPYPFTLVGWEVDNIADTVRALRAKGVELVIYDDMPHDELGIWTAPDGAQVAWFKDIDGNLLSVSQDTE